MTSEGTRSTVVGTSEIALVADVIEGDPSCTIVLLHGLSQQRQFWNPVIARLTTDALHPRIVTIDLRGHGDSGKPSSGPYDVQTCAHDVLELLDELEVGARVVVGHSWGASVALVAAAERGRQTSALVAIDGGFTRLADLGEREDVRSRLTPPRLGMPIEQLFGFISQGELAPWWSEETRAALMPTFEVDEQGNATTRLGFDRHLLVLDGLLHFDPTDYLRNLDCPAWFLKCEPLSVFDEPSERDAWQKMSRESLARCARLVPLARVQRWAGAVHDVPLQWPWQVAGLIRSAVSERTRSEEGAT